MHIIAIKWFLLQKNRAYHIHGFAIMVLKKLAS